MNFINPLGFIALLSVPAIILMYILKQKFKKREVSSMVLWNKAITQSEGHKWRQKLKKNTLMFLQIAAAVLASLALANPFISAGGERLNYIFVVDTSFSMAVEDENGSRLEKAKDDILNIISDSPDGTFFSVVNLDGSPETVLSSTNKKQAAQKAVMQLAQTYGGRDTEALIPILKQLQSENPANVIIFTDKAPEEQIENASINIYGKSGVNYAVKHVSENNGNVLVKAAVYGKAGGTAPVALFGDGVIIDTKDVEFTGANESADIVFSLNGETYKEITAKILSDDILSEDNSFTYIPQVSGVKKALLVTEGNIFIEKAVSVIDGIELYKKQGTEGEIKGYDIYIFDGVLPEAMPKDGHIMIINPPEKSGIAEFEGEIDLSGITVRDGIAGGNAESLSFSANGVKKLATPLWAEEIFVSDGITAAYAGENGGIKTVVFGFDLHNSDLPMKKEFPIIIYNIMSYFSAGGIGTSGYIFAGENAVLNMAPKTVSAQVISPSGVAENVTPPNFQYSLTEEIGVYTIREDYGGGKTAESYFAVNPATEGESDTFNMEESLQGGAAENARINTGMSLKNIMILIMLIVLAAEWRVNWRGN